MYGCSVKGEPYNPVHVAWKKTPIEHDSIDLSKQRLQFTIQNFFNSQSFTCKVDLKKKRVDVLAFCSHRNIGMDSNQLCYKRVEKLRLA